MDVPVPFVELSVLSIFGFDPMRSRNVRTPMTSGSLHVDAVARQLAESFNSLEDESSGKLDPQERFKRYVHS